MEHGGQLGRRCLPPGPFFLDELIFPDVAAQKTNVNDFPAGTECSRITLSGLDYQISGNGITLGDMTAQYPTPVNPVDFPQLSLGLSVRNNAINLASDANMGVVLNGPVGTDLNVTGRYTINGVVSGLGKILTNGDLADLVLTANNTYTGITNIDGGSFGSTERRAQAFKPAVSPRIRRSSVAPARSEACSSALAAILAPGTNGPGTFHSSQVIISGGSYSVDITGAAPVNTISWSPARVTISFPAH